MTDQPKNPSQSVTLGLAWGVLLSSILWTILAMALFINALHAPLSHKTPNMQCIIWGLGIAMILAGGAGMAIGVNRILGRGKWMWIIPAWFIIVAICIWLGAWRDPRLGGNWPWIQAVIGSIILVAAVAAAAYMRRRKGA